MKLIHVGQNEWMFEDSVIEFPKKNQLMTVKVAI